MKKNRLVVVVLSVYLMMPVLTIAQDYAFKVLVNKGKNEVKTNESWQPIKTGATLRSSDELKIVDNSYLGLIHASGRPLEIKQAGKYKVVDLSARVGTGASVLNKYTDFILSSKDTKSNKLSATGAVHRGSEGTKVYLPKSEHAVVFNDSLILNWEKESQPVDYVVSLTSMFGDQLLLRETSDTTLVINLADQSFLNEDNIIVDIYPKNMPDRKQDPPYTIKRLSIADKQRIKAQLKEISAETMEANALNKLILAGFYEQNKLFIDAATAYLQAVKLAPTVNEYQESYQSFLVRNGIKEPRK